MIEFWIVVSRDGTWDEKVYLTRRKAENHARHVAYHRSHWCPYRIVYVSEIMEPGTQFKWPSSQLYFKDPPPPD